MDDSFVKIMKCRFCGGETNALALDRRIKPIKGEVYNPMPCDKCKKLFDSEMMFFIGNCGHQGFIKTKTLKKITTKEAFNSLKGKKIFRTEQCFACMGFIKMEDCQTL